MCLLLLRSCTLLSDQGETCIVLVIYVLFALVNLNASTFGVLGALKERVPSLGWSDCDDGQMYPVATT